MIKERALKEAIKRVLVEGNLSEKQRTSTYKSSFKGYTFAKNAGLKADFLADKNFKRTVFQCGYEDYDPMEALDYAKESFRKNVFRG